MDNKGSRVKMAKKLDQIDKNIGRFTPLPLNIWYDEASEVLENSRSQVLSGDLQILQQGRKLN